MVPVESAALANAMGGHADETDDSHLRGRWHPGCGIVPAALAVAEFADRSGADFLRAVALGYDIGTRFNMALGYPNPNAATHSTHTLGVNFGAAAAAAALLRFDPVKVRYRAVLRRAAGVRLSRTGIATATTSRRRSTSAAWARATASPAR